MIQYYNLHFLICTFFGLGKISKKCPGTIGSIAAIPVSYFILKFSNYIQQYIFNIYSVSDYLLTIILPLVMIFILFFIGTYSAQKYISLTKKHDGKEIVFDEVVGQSLCLVVTIPITFWFLYSAIEEKNIIIYYDVTLLIATLYNLILFRVFDIIKPWPIDLCDKKIKGGFGVMIDDIVAAIFAITIYFATLFVIIDYM